MISLGVGLFAFILFGTLCFLDSAVCFLTRLGKFSAIMSSNRFSVLFSLSSHSGTPIMPMLVSLMLSLRSLKLSSFFLCLYISFSFCCSNWVIAYLPDHRFVLLHHLICCCFPPVCFSFKLLYSSGLIGSFFMSSISLLKLSLCSSIQHQMTITLNSLSGGLLISIAFSLFSDFFFSLFFLLEHIPLSLHLA